MHSSFPFTATDRANEIDKKAAGLKSYPRVYFELMLAGFTVVMGMSLSASFLPIFANDLDPSGVLVGFVVSAWFFSRIFTELPSGVLSDQLGRRKLLVGGLALAAGGAFTCSAANSIYLLIIGRGLWGLGTALFFMSNTALILDLFQSSMRARALGTFQGIEFIGSFMGAPIGGFVAGIIGYRKVFLLAFALMLCSFSVAFTSKGLRRIGTETSGPSTSSIKEVFSRLRSWDLTVTCISSFSRMLIMQGAISTVFPLYLNHQLRISVEHIGVIFSLRTAGHIIATVSSGYFSDKVGRKPMIISGLAIESACFYSYTLLPSSELLLLIGFFEGFGGGMVFTSLIVLLYEVVPSESKTSAIGMYRTFMDLGGFLGPLFFMLPFTSLGSSATFLSAIAIIVLNIALLMTIKSKTRSE